MAKADNAGQITAQSIDKWRVAVEGLLQTLNTLATYADRRQVNSILYYDTAGEELSPEQIQKLSHALLKTRKAFAKLFQEGADNLLVQLGELRGLQIEIMPRLILARNELSKLHGLAGGYQYTWAKLEPLAYAMRRWAVELSCFWQEETIVIDLNLAQAFEQKRASCPWSPAHSTDIRRHFADELSQLLRDLGTHPPIVSSVAEIAKKPPKKQDAKGDLQRRKTGELTDAQEKFAAALREWHGFESETLSCTKCKAISYVELGRLSEVKSKSTATKFFTFWLKGGNKEYKRLCSRGDTRALAFNLAKLSREGALALAQFAGESLAAAKAKPLNTNDD